MDKKFLFLGISSLFLAAILMLGEAKKNTVQVAGPQQVPAVTQEQQPRHRPAKTPRHGQRRHNDPPLLLQNDFIRVEISPTGGGIRSIAMLKYAANRDSSAPWIFDDYDSVQDALTAQLLVDRNYVPLSSVQFHVAESTQHHLLLRGRLSDGKTVERSYELSPSDGAGDPYDLRQRISVVGSGIDAIELSLGSLPATNGDVGDNLKFVSYDGKRAHFTPMRSFSSSGGFFGIGRREGRDSINWRQAMTWAAIKNHFFAAILTPSRPAIAAECAPIDIGTISAGGLGGSVTIPLTADGDRSIVDFSYYVGPLEYVRLDRLGGGRERVMEFGIFGFLGKLLLFALLGVHAIVPNWGWAIVLLTVAVKLLLWPLVTAQVRSSQKMASIQKPLKDIQRRYKLNPKKSQEETLKLFRENGVNPAAGCLPLILQIPIFFGLYSMLRSASELRFAKFLWVKDLSVADTVAKLGPIPLNLLPLFMGITMFMQMRSTPMPTQSQGQRWMLSAMPLICTALCYNFPAGLVLYWTVQNSIGIVQQTLIQRKMRLQAAAVPANQPKKPLKQVRTKLR
ncbi:MAG: membrane protein insertase YidC [Puniceicoccales bacterium]|jgi:YidC/Oxa1 family membrane protein insertase|nr:membrane protein insertase YidC [Puniceicoccales bacterium]